MSGDVGTALMAKLALLFGGAQAQQTGTFVCFALPALPYSAADLDFGSGGAPSSTQQTSQVSFANLVNLVPAVGSQWLSDGRLLWSEYQDALTLAAVAQGSLSAADQQALDAARAVVAQDGADTPKMRAYRQYESAWQQASQAYDTARINAQFSTDPALRAQWQAQEPQLKAAVAAALLDWEVKGFKDEIEQAEAAIQQVSGRSPLLVWSDWRSDFLTSKQGALDGSSFWPTDFAPPQFFTSEESWIRFVLDKSEIDGLTAQASPEIQRLHDAMGSAVEVQSADLDILSVSMKVARVDLLRPWFHADLFSRRFWKWSSPHDALSDGADPPQGRIPAYVRSLVFVREVRIELQGGSTSNTDVLTALEAGKVRMLGPLVLAVHPSGPSGTVLGAAPVDERIAQRIAAPGAGSSPAVHPASWLASPIMRAQLVRPAVAPATSEVPAASGPVGLAARVMIRPGAISDVMVMQPGPAPAQPPPAPPPEQVSQVTQLVAFVCQKVPKSPDPDPLLAW